MTTDDPFANLTDELPPASEAVPDKPKKRHRRPPRVSHKVPNRQRGSPLRNFRADIIAFNYALDRLVGRAFDPDAWPYCEFKRETVEKFVAEIERGEGPSSLERGEGPR